MHLTSIYQLQIKKTLQVKLQVQRTLITLKPRFEFFDWQRPALLHCFVSTEVIPSSIQSSLVIMKEGIDFFRSLKNTQIAKGIFSLMAVFCKINKKHIFSYFMKQRTLSSSPNDLKLQKH